MATLGVRHNVNVDLQALKRSLSIVEPRARTLACLKSLAWDSPDAEVEWAPVQEIGRFTVGGFPTSSSIVPAPDAWTLAWHAGFRVCLSSSRGTLQWFDLRDRVKWHCAAGELTESVVAGLTADSFTRTGRMVPLGVTPESAQELFAQDPSSMLAERIRGWWERYCALTLSGQREQATDDQKSTFTRFIAGVLLLRTIEDTEQVRWFPRERLRTAVSNKSPNALDEAIGEASRKLNSRVLRRISSIPLSLTRDILNESYDIGVNFSALDVDPVGAFYEEILGVSYTHEEASQQGLFDRNVVTITDRTARRAQGVYYTPRIYADTLARVLLRPRIRLAEVVDELPIVADIAAGSGELLCAALREFLAEPAWRSPDVAWTILDSRLQAVDKNALALQLCALNLLRTAVRQVPALFDGRRLLPSLEANLRCGDALLSTTIDGLPSPDVVLINPPFHTPNRWSRPASPSVISELSEVSAHPNQALAFFAAATRITREGASIGVVLPSNVFTGSQSAPWREWLADRVRLDLVVANYGTPFRDTHSYAGLVLGRKRSARQWRARTRVVRIDGGIKSKEWDTGVLLSDSTSERHGVTSKIVPAIGPTSPDWVGSRPAQATLSRRVLPLYKVIGDTFHQGIVLAPEPWCSELFLFSRLPSGKFKHCLSHREVGPLESEMLRPFVNAKQVSRRVPLWCEPAVENTWVFVPPGGGAQWFDVETLPNNSGSRKLADSILDAILNSPRTSSRQGRKFVERARSGHIRFNAVKGFRDSADPLVFASKASPSSVGQGIGAAWFAWLNLAGDAVPVSGLQLRTARPEMAAALVAWMSIDKLVQPLMDASPVRINSSVQWNLSAVAEWMIPDLRDDALQPRLDELYVAFLAYRNEAEYMPHPSELDLSSYREVQKIALSLWRD